MPSVVLPVFGFQRLSKGNRRHSAKESPGPLSRAAPYTLVGDIPGGRRPVSRARRAVALGRTFLFQAEDGKVWKRRNLATPMGRGERPFSTRPSHSKLGVRIDRTHPYRAWHFGWVMPQSRPRWWQPLAETFATILTGTRTFSGSAGPRCSLLRCSWSGRARPPARSRTRERPRRFRLLRCRPYER